MADKESPQATPTEAPQAPEVPTETVGPVDVDGLMEALQKAQIVDPKQLEGHLTNARSYHQMQSERDRYAQELSSIKAQMGEFMEMQRQQPKQQTDPYDYMDSNGPVDLDTIANVVERTLDRREKKLAERNMQHQQYIQQTWNKINSHKHYHLVKEDFEDALRDPVTAMKMQSGEVDPVEFYHNLVNDKLQGLTKQALEALKAYKDTGGTVPPPHIEGEARVGTQQLQPDLTDKDKKIQELAKRGKKPGGMKESDFDELLNLTMGGVLK